MSTREIIAELPGLEAADLAAIEHRIRELTARRAVPTGEASRPGVLRAERTANRLVLAGPRVIRQAEVEAILEEFP